MNVTHEELRKAAFACLRRNVSGWGRKTESVGFGCSLVVSEIVSAAYEVPDALGFSYGRSVLIECKVSRDDFAADARKPHRRGSGAGLRRYFLTTPGLIRVDELPPEWGLLELHGRSVKLVHEPDWSERELDLQGHLSEKRILLSLIGRIKAREFLFISSERMDQELMTEKTCA